MSDLATKALDRLAAAPWRLSLGVVGASFLVATGVSTVAGYMVLPKDSKLGMRPAAHESTTLSVPNPTPTLTTQAVDAIVKRNLFNAEGTTEDQSVGANKSNASGPNEQVITKSDLPVTLVGTIYGGDPYSGIAMVENTIKKTINSFLVGDSLVKEAIVKQILKEKIIVDRGGHLEYIEVARETLTRSRRKKKIAAINPADIIAPIATDPPPPSYKEEGFERKEKEISMTQAYRSKLLTTDFTKVLQDAKATPNMVDGELKGFVLTRIRKDSIYEKAGLQNDDIVTEVNGVPLNDTAQAIRLLNSLRSESEIEVRINRGGTPGKFTMNVK